MDLFTSMCCVCWLIWVLMNDFGTIRSVGKVKYVVCRDQEGRLHAFHNVCRHHAAAVAKGSGCTLSFVCPYHVCVSKLPRRPSAFQLVFG